MPLRTPTRLGFADVDLAQELVERLNRMIEDQAARIALELLVRHPVDLPDGALALHPTAQVWGPGEELNPASGWAITFLGMLNGIVGRIPDGKHAGWGYIAAVFGDGVDDDGSLVRFELTPRG